MAHMSYDWTTRGFDPEFRPSGRVSESANFPFTTRIAQEAARKLNNSPCVLDYIASGDYLD